MVKSAIIPRVSILVPTYNRSAYLQEALISVFEQSYFDFEVIVVDNCSTDDTSMVVASWQDTRLRYIRNEVNIGAVGNYNKALQAAVGEYIYLFSDDDVMINQENIALKVDLLDKMPNVGLVHSSINTINNRGEITGGNWASTTDNWGNLKKNSLMLGADAHKALYYGWNFITMSTVMLRKSVIVENKLAFNNQLNYLIDWALWLQLSLFSDFYFIDEPLVNYRRHSTNESNLMNKKMFFNELIISKFSLMTLFPNVTHLIDASTIIESTNNQLGEKSKLTKFFDKLLNLLKSLVKMFLMDYK